MEIDGEIGTDIQLTAADGHVFAAYVAVPHQTPRGALVVIQDAFGLGRYIRSVCDSYCTDGYVTVAPALYDRQQRQAVFDHSPESHRAAARFRADLNWDHVLADVEAAIAHVNTAGSVGILGFCVGGSVAWLTAASLPVAAAACYYGIPSGDPKFGLSVMKPGPSPSPDETRGSGHGLLCDAARTHSNDRNVRRD